MSFLTRQLSRALNGWNYLSTLRPHPTDRGENRYSGDWNMYSRRWDLRYGSQYSQLGDEWNDDQSEDRKRDSFYFTTYAERWISSGMSVLEVGPGGGKWTVRIAPKVKRMIVLDVAEEMLKRTKNRCDSLGLTNIEYLLASGKDFQPIADETIDFFFSYDVFVHIALEDTWPYTQEIARVLKPGGLGACHYAINSVPEAWERIEQQNDWFRGGKHTLGQFYYFSPETLRRMYESCGLRVVEQHQEVWHCTCVFEKPALSIVPRLEALLKRLMSQHADNDGTRAEIITALRELPSQVEQRLDSVLAKVEKEDDAQKRALYTAEIRRIWRG
jgi:ubiquinone/menaquinone biosynthesis C-methylase UbiE